MPFENQNLNGRYYRGIEIIDLDKITVNVDDKANLEYVPQTVHKIYKSNQITTDDFSGGVSVNQYLVLTNQDIRSENGLYLQTASSTATKQTNPTKNTFFLDVSSEFNKAVFLKEGVSQFLPVNFNSVLLGTSIATSSGNGTSQVIFSYPVPYSRSETIETNIFGKGADDVMFDGQYKIAYYNTAGTSIIKLGDFNNTTKRSDNSAMSIPIVTFGISEGTSGGTLWFTSGVSNAQGFDWFFRSKMTF